MSTCRYGSIMNATAEEFGDSPYTENADDRAERAAAFELALAGYLAAARHPIPCNARDCEFCRPDPGPWSEQ